MKNISAHSEITQTAKLLHPPFPSTSSRDWISGCEGSRSSSAVRISGTPESLSLPVVVLGHSFPSRYLSRMLCLKDIVPAARNNVDTRFILLEKGRTIFEGQNKTCFTLVADETAAVHFQLWGDECDAFEPGDIIHLTSGIFSYNRNNFVLRAGKRGNIIKVGEFTMAYVETPNMSEISWIPDPNICNKFVQDTIISPHSRIFPPLL